MSFGIARAVCLCLLGIVISGGWLSAPADASCNEGDTPSYDDVVYIAVSQYQLVLPSHPRFVFDANHYSNSGSYQVSLTAKGGGVPFKGEFVAADSRQTFDGVLAVLRRHAFFDMRLQPLTNRFYLDPPEDEITVVRCGVITTLGTAPRGKEFDLNGAQGQALRALFDDLRNEIFRAAWATATPSP